MTRTFRIALALTLAPVFAAADEVHLVGGGRVSGEVVDERSDAVVIEVAAGRITLPRHRIERVVRGTSALAEYRARAARLAAGDVEGWMALGEWARANDLLTQARAAFEHVLRVSPSHGGAHAAIGHVAVNGRWMTPDESYRARGYVQFEGSWVRPEERQAMLEERAQRAAERRERVESDARVREADARARAAEAEARRVEAEAARTADDQGIPYPYGFGGGGAIFPGDGVFFPEPPPPAPVVVIKVDRSHGHAQDGSHPRRPAPSRTKGSKAGIGKRPSSGDGGTSPD